MIDSTFKAGIAGNIHALHDVLLRAMADATTACQDLEKGNPRAAVGAVLPIEKALKDAQVLLDAVLILNRELQ